jgi:hypothetical protein
MAFYVFNHGSFSKTHIHSYSKLKKTYKEEAKEYSRHYFAVYLERRKTKTQNGEN